MKTKNSNIIRSGWQFRITNFDDTIMVICYHERKCYSHVRFFKSENLMLNFIDFVCLQTEMIDKGID